MTMAKRENDTVGQTARAARGAPTRDATCPYVTTQPLGMRRTNR